MPDDADTLERTDQERRVARRPYDPEEDTTLGVAIVCALADAQDVSPVELKSPTLYECVDVASLETVLFRGNGGITSQRGSRTVKFQYAEYAVTVTSDGWIEVYESSSTDVAEDSGRS
jgi:hypothetical protein